MAPRPPTVQGTQRGAYRASGPIPAEALTTCHSASTSAASQRASHAAVTVTGASGSGEPKERPVTVTGASGEPKERRVTVTGASGESKERGVTVTGASGEPKERRVTVTGVGGNGQPKERRVTVTGGGGSGQAKERRVTVTGAGGSGQPKERRVTVTGAGASGDGWRDCRVAVICDYLICAGAAWMSGQWLAPDRAALGSGTETGRASASLLAG